MEFSAQASGGTYNLLKQRGERQPAPLAFFQHRERKMPKFRFELLSHRDRPVTDLVDTFIFSGPNFTLRDERGLKPTSKRFTVDAQPGNYELQLEIEGFKLFRKNVKIAVDTPPVIEVKLTHRCSVLPEFDDLHAAQRALLATFNPEAERAWRRLSDNQAATFFQLSHALNNTFLSNRRPLSSYIETVRRIGGAQIEDNVLYPHDPNKSRTATGWRMHVVIREADREGIVDDLMRGDVFGRQDDSTHSTHRKFGLTKSHRQRGILPRLQIVLSKDYTHADVDLDVELHRSSPHHVFGHFIKRFPEVEEIYRF